jgi:Flp pilus assembly pilin Flp
MLRKHSAGLQEGEWPRSATPAAPLLTKEWAMIRLTKILRCQKGANAIEYALVASLISIAALAAFHQLGDAIDTMYGNVSNKM